MESNNQIISVVMITYNHSRYIREAIEGVLMQQCDFDLELIIADDSSPDDTMNIVNELIETHPEGGLIKYTKHTTNLGMMPNFIWALQQCKGKYVAICEGDDYWTDSLKLHKQISYLETNSDCIFTFHKVQEYNQNAKTFKNDNLNEKELEKLTFKQAFSKNYAHTPSIVFRTPDFSQFPDFYYTAIPGDHVLQILLLKNGGYARYFPDVMAVYRKHDGGIWSPSKGKKFQLARAITRINLYNYFGKKRPKACNRLADYVAENGFKKIGFFEYYGYILSQFKFKDFFNPKYKHILFPFLVKKK